MKLSPQKQRIFELYESGEWVCSTAIFFIRDFRKRISEMNREGFVFQSMKCDGRCGSAHNSNVHMYRLVEKPPKPVDYVRHPLTGERITTEEFAKL